MEMIKEFDALAEKLYPDKLVRDGTAQVCRLIVSTERFIDIQALYKDVLEESRRFAEIHDILPGSFLKWKDDKIKADLRDLINMTFKEIEHD